MKKLINGVAIVLFLGLLALVAGWPPSLIPNWAAKAPMKDMTPDKAHKMAMASLEKEMRRCKMEAMEYEDEPTLDEAYEDDKD